MRLSVIGIWITHNLGHVILLHEPYCRPNSFQTGSLALSNQVEQIVGRILSKRPRPDGDSGVTTGHVSISVMGADEVQLWDELVRDAEVGLVNRELNVTSAFLYPEL